MGGNAFENVGSIHKDEVEPTLEEIALITGYDVRDLTHYTMGSLGKAEFSGDIDIALREIDPKAKNAIKIKLIAHLGEENVRTIGSLLTFCYPITNYQERETTRKRTGFVQVDFKFGNREWLKFFFHSPGDSSKFKGGHRNGLMAAIAKNIIEYQSSTLDDQGRPDETVRWLWSSLDGLVKIRRTTKKKKDGTWNKTQTTVRLSSPMMDPEKICSVLLAGKGSMSDLDSLETLMDAVERIYPHQVEAIYKDFIVGLHQDLGDTEKYPFPDKIAKFSRKTNVQLNQ